MRQGPPNEISEYIRRFSMVVTGFVRSHLTDETIQYYFIEGFNKQTTMCKVLNTESTTMQKAQEAGQHLERIKKENDRMWNQTMAPVSAFIPAQYVPLQQAGSKLLEPL